MRPAQSERAESTGSGYLARVAPNEQSGDLAGALIGSKRPFGSRLSDGGTGAGRSPEREGTAQHSTARRICYTRQRTQTEENTHTHLYTHMHAEGI